MGLIERDDRRWTIESHDDDYLGHDSATVLDGPDVIEPVEVVPASQLAGAVEALETIREAITVNGRPVSVRAERAVAIIDATLVTNRGSLSSP